MAVIINELNILTWVRTYELEEHAIGTSVVIFNSYNPFNTATVK